MSPILLALSLSLAAPGDVEVLSGVKKKTELAPWWAGADVSVGLTSSNPMWSLHVRGAWLPALYRRGGHHLVGLVQLGTGLAMSLPVNMTAHYQHVALVGVGYRKVGPLLNWGFQWGIGANWYRTAYDVYPLESRVVVYTEGRGQIGARVLPHLVLSAYFGYASPVSYDPRYPGQQYLGGIMFGLSAEWR